MSERENIVSTGQGQDWETVLTTNAREVVREFALHLDARRIPHQVTAGGRLLTVSVPRLWLEPAQRELAAYQHDRRTPAPGDKPMPMPGSGALGVAAYLCVIVCVAWLAGRDTFGLDWLARGRIDAAAIRDGQVWRLVTALTLHADLAHLLGNALFGGLFGYFIGRHIGDARGWLLILTAGSGGNFINVLVHRGDHFAIGASTAVFAALGLLAMLMWRHGFDQRMPWRRRFGPVFAAIALLAYTGTGGENTDLGAHLFGFLAGIAAGATGLVMTGRAKPWVYGAVAAGFIAGSWILALAL